jgi:hypothetical protein
VNAPIVARSFGSNVWHDLNRGAATWRTMCGRDATSMARFHPADLPSGERSHRACARCTQARGIDPRTQNSDASSAGAVTPNPTKERNMSTNKYTLTLSDGSTKQYARKVEAVAMGTKSGGAFTVQSPSGAVVHVHELKPKAAVKSKATKAKGVPAAERLGTFTVTGKEGQTHKCVGACGKTLPVTKFPTTGREGVRAAECRVDRDARTKAAKAAKAAQA